MQTHCLVSLAKRKKADALILPFFAGKKPAFSSPKELSGLLAPVLKSGDFTGKKEEVICHYGKSSKEARVVLVGLGKEKELTEETLRRSYACAVNALKEKTATVNIVLPQSKNFAVTPSVAEGVLLANYIFDATKSEKGKQITDFTFIGADENELERTHALCESVSFTRNLIFSNADTITPQFLGKMAEEIAKEYASVKTTVLGPKEIAKEKMGLLQAVSRGAGVDPAVILLEYRGAPKDKELTALVGKGVTFDTGGLNLKPTGGMETMRDDMSGGAAILGTMRALAELKLPVNVIAIIGATENAIGPHAYKPGDVYISHAGITVEIANTDAEGRLVLADMLSYVQEKYSPTMIIDIATLTGGAIIALGEEVSALMSNDKMLAKRLKAAGDATYERVWELPLHEEYAGLLKSKFADIKNSGVRKASAIQAATFLKKFIKKAKWAHLDIAGTAFPEALKPYHPIQATGVGVRLLISFFEQLLQ